MTTQKLLQDYAEAEAEVAKAHEAVLSAIADYGEKQQKLRRILDACRREMEL